jgi:hypothetical protein
MSACRRGSGEWAQPAQGAAAPAPQCWPAPAFSLKWDINRNGEAIRDADRSTTLTVTGVITAGVCAYLFWSSRRPRHD